MSTIAGIDGQTRKELSEILRRSKSIISVGEAASILEKSPREVAKLLARWVEQGWMVRVRRGLYASVPLESKTPENVIEDPQIVAMKVFEPCYIGGWSAAEYWGLTEQIFKTIIVVTTKPIRQRKVKIQSSEFLIRQISNSRFFGMKVIWKERVQVYISDPTKTIVDMLDDPAMSGGIRMLERILKEYLSSSNKNLEQLLTYAAQMKNGAIYKRLGYLLERSGIKDDSLMTTLRESITTGNAKLDPALPAERLITKWRLWVPENWKESND